MCTSLLMLTGMLEFGAVWGMNDDATGECLTESGVDEAGGGSV